MSSNSATMVIAVEIDNVIVVVAAVIVIAVESRCARLMDPSSRHALFRILYVSEDRRFGPTAAAPLSARQLPARCTHRAEYSSVEVRVSLTMQDTSSAAAQTMRAAWHCTK